MTRRTAGMICIVAGLLLGGCGAADRSNPVPSTAQEVPESTPVEEEPVSRELFAMDTYMTLTAYGDHADAALDAGEARIRELDTLLSTGNEQSEIGQINQNGEGMLSDDGRALMNASLTLYDQTEGAFDIAVYPLMSLWGFPTQEYRVPTAEEIQETLTRTKAGEIAYDRETGKVSFPKEGMAIDFGGIAKGYTSQSLMELFREQGVTSAIISLGGNVQALGSKPDGSAWNVAVRTPDETGNILCAVQVRDEAVITSGGYERYFEKDGVTYHHILDPESGYPSESGLTSVTIISQDGTAADALSTSLFIMGKERAVAFWRSQELEFEMILVEQDGTISATEGLSDRLSSELPIEMVTKEE